MSKEDEWVKIGRKDDFKEGEIVPVSYGRRKVIVVKFENKIYAYSGRCTHYGEPLENGIVLENIINCPCHNAQFNILDGSVILPPALDNLIKYEVKAENGDLFIRKSKRKEIEVPQTLSNETFVIIGSGAAGYTCAVALRKEGFGGRIVIVTDEDVYPYDRTALSKEFISGEFEEKDIFLKSESYYKKLKIDFLFNYKVTDIDFDKKVLITAHGAQVSYDKLLISTGGIPKTPQVPGVDKDGFFLLRNLFDAKSIKKYLKGKTRVVIIGAGFLGLELASTLISNGYEVHVIQNHDIPLTGVFGNPIGEYIKKLHIKHGVKFYRGEISQILGDERVDSVILEDNTVIKTDAVVACIGIIPSVAFLEGTPILEGNAVPVDEMLQTRVEDVFAAGDIAMVPDYHTGEIRRIEHWIEAQRQGQHAARTMMGRVLPYREVPFFWTIQYDVSIKYTGYSRDFDEIVYRGNVDDNGFLAGFYEGKKLRAVLGVNRDRDMAVMYEFLKADFDITPSEFKDESVDLKRFYLKRLGY